MILSLYEWIFKFRGIEGNKGHKEKEELIKWYLRKKWFSFVPLLYRKEPNFSQENWIFYTKFSNLNPLKSSPTWESTYLSQRSHYCWKLLWKMSWRIDLSSNRCVFDNLLSCRLDSDHFQLSKEPRSGQNKEAVSGVANASPWPEASVFQRMKSFKLCHKAKNKKSITV